MKRVTRVGALSDRYHYGGFGGWEWPNAIVPRDRVLLPGISADLKFAVSMRFLRLFTAGGRVGWSSLREGARSWLKRLPHRSRVVGMVAGVVPRGWEMFGRVDNVLPLHDSAFAVAAASVIGRARRGGTP